MLNSGCSLHYGGITLAEKSPKQSDGPVYAHEDSAMEY
jgi:hypothetical protein